jgi:hypothetical protein
MPTVSEVVFLRPRPGKIDAFISDVARARKIIASCGAKVRVWNQIVGAESGTTAVVIETADWKAYGEYNAKLEDNREWQAFLTEINSAKEPNAEIFRTLLNVEISG